MRDQPGPDPQRRRRWLSIPERYLRLLALAVVVAVFTVAFALRDMLQVPAAEALGYPAVFLISLMGNATVVFPVPAILAVCSGGIVLAPLIVGLVAGIAMALGETTGYLAGFSGSNLARNNRVYRRVQPWMERRGWIVVLLFASIPNPLFDIVGMAAGATRMPLWRFLGAAWAGKTAMGIATAYGCAIGYDLFLGIGEAAG